MKEYAGHIINRVNNDRANRYEYRLPILFLINSFIGYTIYKAMKVGIKENI